MSVKIILIIVIIVPLLSCGQVKNQNKYNENIYIKSFSGADWEYPNYPYVIIYKNQNDSNLKLKKIYFDSLYSKPLAKFFYYKGLPNGPFEIYVNGKISRRGNYKMDKLDGERLSYENGILIQKAYFEDGKKSGIWKYYNIKGELVQEKVFINDTLKSQKEY